ISQTDSIICFAECKEDVKSQGSHLWKLYDRTAHRNSVCYRAAGHIHPDESGQTQDVDSWSNDNYKMTMDYFFSVTQFITSKYWLWNVNHPQHQSLDYAYEHQRIIGTYDKFSGQCKLHIYHKDHCKCELCRDDNVIDHTVRLKLRLNLLAVSSARV